MSGNQRVADVPTDSAPLRRGLFRRIGTRLAVCFSLGFVGIMVLVDLMDITGVPWSPYQGRWKQAEAEAFERLSLVADLKKTRLKRWMRERRDDARWAARSPLVQEDLPALRTFIAGWKQTAHDGRPPWTSIQQETSYQRLRRFLEEVSRSHGVFDEIQLADRATGTVLVSTNVASLGEDISDHDYFMAPLESKGPCVSPVELVPETSHPVFHISHAVNAADPESGEPKEGQPVAVLVMQVDVDDIIKPMLHTGEGLGKHGEALLVNQQRIILTSLKHPLADGSNPQPLEYQISAKPALLAAGGEEGLIDDVDYRGEPVLAAYRHIRVNPEWGWGLVVKRDKADLFAPIRQALVYSVSVSVAGVLAFIALAIVLARSLTLPIRSLGQTADQVAEGNLSARGQVFACDEVGLLAITFNDMLNRVQNWHRELEREVLARTDQLSTANHELKAEISERKRAEREREKLVAELEAKNAELERFTYTVSHDLKSPLITIQGFLGLAERAVAEGNLEEFRSDVATVGRAVKKMERLLAELLDLSRAGRMMSTPEELSLEELARVAVDLVAGKIDENGVQVEMSPDLPTVRGDRLRLQEVLQNLIENGVKYMGEQPHPQIKIGVRRDGDEPIIFVQDNGMGINARYHQRVFDLFEKLDSRAEGTGVGLALVKRIVEVHGGRIWVESEGEGTGSVFCFTLPMVADSAE